MSATFRIIDKGWERILRQMRLMDKSFTKVGVQQDTTREDSEVSDMVLVATWNEFGTKNIPERSFIRETVDKKKKRIFGLKKRMYGDILDGKKSTRRALEIIGEYAQSQTQLTIKRKKNPPNALSTQRAKGRKLGRKNVKLIDNPLIDTGQLIQSIRHVEVMQ